MPRPIDETARAETIVAIKENARQQMADNGTAGISLRAIARAMGVTAPAIYNYFKRLDDLITALIIDAFNGLADAVDEAVTAAADKPYAEQLQLGMLAYRQWALAHPADFQLIYGNPIPKYEAPAEITVPLARRPLEIFTRLFLEGLQVGEFQMPPAYQQIAPTIKAHMQGWMVDAVPPEVPAEAIYVILVAWSRIHGIVMLELFQHISPTVGDVTTLYNRELDLFIAQLTP